MMATIRVTKKTRNILHVLMKNVGAKSVDRLIWWLIGNSITDDDALRFESRWVPYIQLLTSIKDIPEGEMPKQIWGHDIIHTVIPIKELGNLSQGWLQLFVRKAIKAIAIAGKDYKCDTQPIYLVRNPNQLIFYTLYPKDAKIKVS